MCGIFGYSLKQNVSVQPSFDLNKVLNSMKFRGPDSTGTYVNGPVGLGFNRLSIVGVNESNVPLTSRDGRYTIVYNGEVFNANELRQSLKHKGYVFITESGDTEVLLAAYCIYGDKCVNYFNGMFAFVVFDSVEQTLTGFVDSTGIKPLFFSRTDDGFFFSSELSTIRKELNISYSLNYASVFDYFRLQYVPFDQTIYKGVYKLTPGRCFKYDVKNYDLQIYSWYHPREKITSRFNPNDFKILFEDAVVRWAMSEVSFGVSLSDGLDSSLITTVLSKKGFVFNTYTLFYDIGGYGNYNELTLSKALSRKYDLNHVLVRIDKDILSRSMPRVFQSLSEPYSGGISSFFIYSSMREHGEKVALTGVGGDELFGNYRKWEIYSKPIDLIRQSLRNIIDERLLNPGIYGLNYKLFMDNRHVKSLFNDDFYGAYRDYSSNFNLRKRVSNLANEKLGIEDSIRRIDLSLQLPYEFLMMTDRFSMYNSIEARTPFLDKELMQLILDFNYSDISNPKDPKLALSNLFRDYNNDLVKDRSKKGFGFPDDLFYDVNKDLIDYLLSEEFIKKQNIFNIRIVANRSALGKTVYRSLVYFQLWYYFNEIE